jgi:competence protein ComEA
MIPCSRAREVTLCRMAQRVDRTHLLLGVLVVLGIGWRALDSALPRPSTSATALDRQIAAVDSARVARSRPRSEQKSRPRQPTRTSSQDGRAEDRSIRTETTPPGAIAPSATPVLAPAASLTRVDVDRASAVELEALPRIGPSLAKRIVADRSEHGPFGTLEGLQRVKGIGPRMAAQLAPYVTFGSLGRPQNVASTGAPGHSARPSKSRPKTDR